MVELESTNKLQIEELSHSIFGNQMFKGVSLELNAGEMLLMIGRNGVGKSTFLKCICDILKPSSGRVLFNGSDNNFLHRKNKLATTYSYLSQNSSYTPDIVAGEYAVTGRSPHIKAWGRPKKNDYNIVMDCFSFLGIEHLYNKSYSTLSGGEQQQVKLARILCQESKVILLDEPTNQLDIKNQIVFLNMIKLLQKKGYIIIFTTHNPFFARYFDNCRIGVLKSGCKNIEFCTSYMLTYEYISQIYNIDYRQIHALYGNDIHQITNDGFVLPHTRNLLE